MNGIIEGILATEGLWIGMKTYTCLGLRILDGPFPPESVFSRYEFFLTPFPLDMIFGTYHLLKQKRKSEYRSDTNG